MTRRVKKHLLRNGETISANFFALFVVLSTIGIVLMVLGLAYTNSLATGVGVFVLCTSLSTQCLVDYLVQTTRAKCDQIEDDAIMQHYESIGAGRLSERR